MLLPYFYLYVSCVRLRMTIKYMAIISMEDLQGDTNLDPALVLVQIIFFTEQRQQRRDTRVIIPIRSNARIVRHRSKVAPSEARLFRNYTRINS